VYSSVHVFNIRIIIK